MRTLNLMPMISALRDRPGDFVMEKPWLRHRPSGHSFLILDGALARIETRCSCAELRPDPSQTDEFARVFNAWMSDYWKPLQAESAAERRAAEINRQFAAHFRPPTLLMRMRMRLTDAWRAAGEVLTRPAPARLAIELLIDQPSTAADRSESSSPRQHETVGA
jgi:hypothetical protein